MSLKVANISDTLFRCLQKGGFFVECGAFDGELSSNTIYLEQKLKWSGLLIEMDPSWYLQLRGKNRKSFTINACVSPHQYPLKVSKYISLKLLTLAKSYKQT